MKLSLTILPLLCCLLNSSPAAAEAGADGQNRPHVNTEIERPPKDQTWEHWHMAHEHQMEKYTPEEFFDLHDLNKKGFLDKRDILSLYGLDRKEIVGTGDGMGTHDDSEEVDELLANNVVTFVMKLLDVDDNSRITRKEYLDYASRGNEFPDLGVGVGHHSDFEAEYDVHHWNKYHRDSDPEIKNVHKEDIEHELLHHEHEIEHEERIQRGSSRGTVITDDELESRINLARIPDMFRNGLF